MKRFVNSKPKLMLSINLKRVKSLQRISRLNPTSLYLFRCWSKINTKGDEMTFDWKSCELCDRKYLQSLKDKHYAKFHSGEKRDVKEDIPSIPFMYNDKVKKLLRGSKLQVIRQKPQLLVRVAPFIHQDVELDDDIVFEIGKSYIIKETE